MKTFEDRVLLLASNPETRIFFCSHSTFRLLNPCVEIINVAYNNQYVIFSTKLVPNTTEKRYQSCRHQTCKYCKGYGLGSPFSVYSSIYTLGLTPFRYIPTDWDKEIYNLLECLVNIYQTKKSVDCLSCILRSNCTLQYARRKCVPVQKSDYLVMYKNPFFDPPTKGGVFPFMFIDPQIRDRYFCTISSVRVQSATTSQQGLGKRPRLYIAESSKVISQIEIPKAVWELCYQYFVSRFYKLGLKIKPFIPTPRVEEQIHFGPNFKQIKNNSDFLWRTRPLVSEQVYLETRPYKIFCEVLPWNLKYEAIENSNISLHDRLHAGLKRIFGIGLY